VIDLLYLAHNRREFSRATLAAMRANTEWPLVRRIVLYDDASVDGTAELLAAFRAPVETVFRPVSIGSPVGVMNHFLVADEVAPLFVKIDSDTMLPPRWLTACSTTMEQNPHVDLLGLEAMRPVDANVGRRHARPAEYIGGIGIMRTDAFSKSLPRPNGRFGFTAWQADQVSRQKAWIDPALPVCLLDRMPLEPWKSLSAEYVKQGWQRPWEPYRMDQNALWDWWTK
jgi:hypothetical protein